jgi:hypothetical protein
MHHMGYLSPDFDYDLFISYAHGDFDKAGSSPLKVWSQGFAAKLVEELRLSLEGEQLVAFLDENSRPGFGIDPTGRLPSSSGMHSRLGFLVVLMSPFYLQPRVRAADWFVAEAKRRQRGDGLLRRRIWPTKAEIGRQLRRGRETLPGFWLLTARKFAAAEGGPPFGWEIPEHDRRRFRGWLMSSKGSGTARGLQKRREERRREEETERKLAEPAARPYLTAGIRIASCGNSVDNLERAGTRCCRASPTPTQRRGPEGRKQRVGRWPFKASHARCCCVPSLAATDMDLANVGMRTGAMHAKAVVGRCPALPSTSPALPIPTIASVGSR